MITNDGWLDWATRLVPTNRHVNSGVNPVRGIFLHSAEGYAGTLLDPNSQYGYNGNHSWHLTNLFDGRLYQHYPFTARCWHATAANDNYLGMENEGYQPREPTLTDAQVATIRRVIGELSQRYGWQPSRPSSTSDRSHTLWEHNEVVRLGGTYSTCPNGRIPWDKILGGPAPQPQPIEEDDMIRHVRLHADNHFSGREVPRTGILLNNPRHDFGLPDEARAVRLEILLRSGHIKVNDGDGAAYAGRVGIAGERYGLVDVEIPGNAMSLYGDGDDCVVEWMGCVGYFR